MNNVIGRHDMTAPPVSGVMERGWSDLLENQIVIMEALDSLLLRGYGTSNPMLESRIKRTKEFLSGR